MQRMRSVLALAALLSMAFAGCLSDDGPADDAPDTTNDNFDLSGNEGTITPTSERDQANFVTDGPYSYVLREKLYDVLPGKGKTITVDMPLGSGLPTANVHMGLFFPDIDGCDWDSLMDQVDGSAIQSVDDIIMGDTCRLPVITDIGPYYGEALLGDIHATLPANRLGGFLIENFVPQGYIVAQVSVTGTGDSTGCMDLMGPAEQAGVQGAVHYLGSAGFSNGAVAPIGRSYDGSTPYEAVMDGNPYVKTIVPISGLYGQMDLMWRNGSVETRGPGVLWGLYYVFTYTGNDPISDAEHFDGALLAQQIASNLVCPETQTGAAQAAAAYVLGGDGGESRNPYWASRSFDGDVLANYDGSVYFIHGMQDWNVDPHMAFPFYNKLEAKGLEMKGMFGQWGHNYPDRVSEHPNNIRYDWAQDLLEWFDHYLKGTGPQPQLHVEMEGDDGQWRIESTWPPADRETLAVGFDEMTIVSGDEEIHVLENQLLTGHFLNDPLVLNLPVQATETRISGLPNMPVTVTTTGPGGQLYAQLDDATTGKKLGHAIMDLRYHAGGEALQVVVPGSTITAMMEFFPLDVLVPAGNQITLTIGSFGQDYLPSVISTPVTVHVDGDSMLNLPTVDRMAGQGFFNPPGWVPGEGTNVA